MPENPLSIGKIRGLSQASNKHDIFTILALDHRQSFARMIDASNPEAVSYSEIVTVKSAFVNTLATKVSAVLLDPIYGAAQMIAGDALPGSAGLLVAVEDTGYAGEPTARLSSILANWGVAKIKKMGASAVKLLVYYHPGSADLAEKQEALVKQVIQDCQSEDIPLFLEVVTYSLKPEIPRNSAEFAVELPDILVNIAKRMGALKPEVLKLEFPVNVAYDPDENSWRKACEAVTKAAPCPWTLLSAGANFELFTRQVKIACQAGASGFIAGRSVWKEGVSLPPGKREAWLEETAATRIEQLTEIANHYARPWSEFFTKPAPSELDGWYKHY